ncbi:MAG: hypothetical protein KAT16_09185 [Candidatus Heimdallarchaeota archaeon]|nr:hypothetical protein [Candidatus Heimdallarchaeota archaeon]
MTGQMSDTLRYQKEQFDITGVKGDGLFHPEDAGLISYSCSTACWNGYLTTYEIVNDELLLAELLINTKKVKDINGIQAEKLRDSSFTHQFSHLNLKIPFTGNLLIGNEFIQSMYVHMGFQRPITYRKLIELKIRNGNLLESADLSRRIEEIRESGKNYPPSPHSPSDEDIGKWVEHSFSRDYD